LGEQGKKRPEGGSNSPCEFFAFSSCTQAQEISPMLCEARLLRENDAFAISYLPARDNTKPVIYVPN
jgi:hypothetical protein